MTKTDQKQALTGQQQQIRALAGELMQLAADTIVVNLRFLDIAVFALPSRPKEGLLGASTDGKYLYYDPLWLLLECRERPAFALRLYLHSLLHCIFFHSYGYDKLDRKLWDLAADLAVENTILELSLPAATLPSDPQLLSEIGELGRAMNPESEEVYHHSVLWNQMGMSRREKKKKLPFTAENIYRYLKDSGLSREKLGVLKELSFRDEHISWEVLTQVTPSLEAFKKIAERVKADLKSFSKDKVKSGSLSFNLTEATREKYDYRQILASFATFAEDMTVSDEEFDYIYYTYGLSTYGNMPLVEPLEYREAKKIRDFVIAIDTSASCRNGLVERFLKQTLTVLKNSESFFTRVNIHILQCDDRVRRDDVITDEQTLDAYMKDVKMEGLGSTDFRPAFEHVQKLVDERKLENIKGLIYFTDGYGTYPEIMPPYKTLFVFMDEDDHRPQLPVWAMSVVIGDEEENEGSETE